MEDKKIFMAGIDNKDPVFLRAFDLTFGQLAEAGIDKRSLLLQAVSGKWEDGLPEGRAWENGDFECSKGLAGCSRIPYPANLHRECVLTEMLFRTASGRDDSAGERYGLPSANPYALSDRELGPVTQTDLLIRAGGNRLSGLVIDLSQPSDAAAAVIRNSAAWLLESRCERELASLEVPQSRKDLIRAVFSKQENCERFADKAAREWNFDHSLYGAAGCLPMIKAFDRCWDRTLAVANLLAPVNYETDGTQFGPDNFSFGRKFEDQREEWERSEPGSDGRTLLEDAVHRRPAMLPCGEDRCDDAIVWNVLSDKLESFDPRSRQAIAKLCGIDDSIEARAGKVEEALDPSHAGVSMPGDLTGMVDFSDDPPLSLADRAWNAVFNDYVSPDGYALEDLDRAADRIRSDALEALERTREHDRAQQVENGLSRDGNSPTLDGEARHGR